MPEIGGQSRDCSQGILPTMCAKTRRCNSGCGAQICFPVNCRVGLLAQANILTFNRRHSRELRLVSFCIFASRQILAFGGAFVAVAYKPFGKIEENTDDR